MLMVVDINKFMEENIPKCHILLFLASENSVKSEACLYELELAWKNNLGIIQIKNETLTWQDLDLRESNVKEIKLHTKVGLEYNSSGFDNFCNNLYQNMQKYKREVNLFAKEDLEIDESKLRFKNLILEMTTENPRFRDFIKNNEELFNDIPADFRTFSFNLPQGRSELEVRRLLRNLADKNIEFILATGARTVITGCPYCYRTFNNR